MRSMNINVIVVIAGFSLIFALYSFFYSFHHDLAGGLLSRALSVELGGAFEAYTMYSPPVEAIWYSVSIGLHRAIGWNISTVLVLQTGLAAMVSAWLGHRIWSANAAPNRLMFSVAFLILLLAPVAYKNIFGLREPMVILGLWPYLILRLSQEKQAGSLGLGLRFGIGSWLGCFLLFKPFYSILVLLVELIHAIHRRRPGDLFRVENVAAGSIVALYLLLWLGLDPSKLESIRLYKETIAASELSTAGSLENIVIWLVPALPMLWIGLRKGGSVGEQSVVFGAVVGAILVAWLQERWYTHHVYPILMAYIFWWWILARRCPFYAHFIIAAAVLYVFYGGLKGTAPYQNQVETLTLALRAGNVSLAGKRVGVLSAHPSPYNEVLLNEGALRWTPTANIAYISTEYLDHDLPGNLGKLLPPIEFKKEGARLLHGQLMQLWTDHPPDFLIFDESHTWPLKNIRVPWQDAFAEDSRFTSILSRYRMVHHFDGETMRFTLYARAL